jgi:chaperonin cofactor prefoldin
MVHEAQQRKASILDELTSAKNLLERKIEELRSFEKDYRGRLKGFISEQLEKLEHTAVDPAADQAEGDAEDDAQQS